MKLETARLCLDCEEVTDGATCPACSNKRLWPIALWLDRRKKETNQRRIAA